mgnify:CR=1 FL=1
MVVMRSLKDEEIEGVLDTLGKISLEPVLKPLVDILNPLIEALDGEEISEFSDKEKESITELTNSIIPAFPILLELLGSDLVAKLVQNIEKVKLPSVGAEIRLNKGAIATVNVELPSVTNIAAPVISMMLPIIAPLIPTVTKLVPPLVELLPAVREILKPEVLESLISTISVLLKAVTPMLPVLLKTVESTGGLIQKMEETVEKIRMEVR